MEHFMAEAMYTVEPYLRTDQALIDGPTTSVPRQSFAFKRLVLTPLKIRLARTSGSPAVARAWEKEGVSEKWEKTSWAKKLERRKRRAALSDFDRFKVMLARKEDLIGTESSPRPPQFLLGKIRTHRKSITGRFLSLDPHLGADRHLRPSPTRPSNVASLPGMSEKPKVIIVGSLLSPYVRKVVYALNLKGIKWEVDMLSPWMGNNAFTKLSPVRRIPVLIHGDFTVCDSTAICEYISEAFPEGPPLYPPVTDPKARARARWIEEYADTRVGDAVTWSYFAQRVLRVVTFGEKPDPERVRKAEQVDIPDVLTYIEGLLQGTPGMQDRGGFMFGTKDPLVPEVALCAFFRNLRWGRGEALLDPSKWPNAFAYIDRVLDHPAFGNVALWEDITFATPSARRKEELVRAGCPVVDLGLTADKPRYGFFRASGAL
ncbi:Glutathione S-transferase 5 [Gonapodya sp. JEL0774]|nr:Glutathione S-transferase 5 [Gonapodya sp. JEL0774]